LVHAKKDKASNMYRIKLMVALMVATALGGLALTYFAVQGSGGALSTLGVKDHPARHQPSD
jgi:hypothetical protein